jgi:hypothetical protein
MPIRLLLRALLVAALAATRSALAAEPPLASLPVVLEVEGCEPLDERELFDLLSVEFKTLGVTTGAHPERLKVECRGTRALVTLRSSSAESAALAIRLDMAATMPAARSRLLALAISELVVEGRSRDVEPQPLRTEDARSLPTEAHVLVPPERLLDPAIVGAASLRYAAGPATWLVGAAIGAELPLSSVFCAGFDARAESGSTDTVLAKVGWTSLSAGAALLAGGRLRHLGWGLGPGFRAGHLRLAATPTIPVARGASVVGLWAGPLLAARARYDLAGRAYVHAGFEVGWTIAPVTGNVSDGRPLMDVSGVWSLLTAGMGLAF